MRVIFVIFALSPAVAIADGIAPAFSPQQPTYTTGATAVSKLTIDELAGSRIPDNLSAIARDRAKVSSAVSADPDAQDIGARSANVYQQGCMPTASSFDWTSKNVVSPIKSQGSCGSCYIFAATAAFESSWYLQNNDLISLSEQQIMDCGDTTGCAKGYHDKIFEYLQKTGAAPNATYASYDGIQSVCRGGEHQYRVVNWSFLDGLGTQASPSAIKEALCTHGPIVSSVFATPDFVKYKAGVFNEFAEGKGSGDINHDVLIVGWDNAKDAWRIKNSWGVDWGESGFMWIRYRSNYIGMGAAWVDAARINAPPAAQKDPAKMSAIFKSLNARLDAVSKDAVSKIK